MYRAPGMGVAANRRLQRLHDYQTLGTSLLRAVSCAVLVAASTTISATAAHAVTAPPSSTSYYVTAYDTTWAFNKGKALGAADAAAKGTQTHYVVLDFGAMTLSGSTWYLSCMGSTKITLSKAREMVEAFGRGYYYGTASDLTSTAHVALGTNNSAGAITAAAGKALAEAATKGSNNLYAGRYLQSRIIGGNDFEAFGGNAKHSNSSVDWINGYNSYPNGVSLVNYGSADGCPTSGIEKSSCNVGLNAEAIWQVSWSGRAWPLPEIYSTSGTNAKQWAALSLYSVNKHSSRMFFRGSMTQAGACAQNGNKCPNTNNSAKTGWTQLYNALNANAKTATTPTSSTDIKWK